MHCRPQKIMPMPYLKLVSSAWNGVLCKGACGKYGVPSFFTRHVFMRSSSRLVGHKKEKYYLLRQQAMHFSYKHCSHTTPVFMKAKSFPERIALVDHFGSHTYEAILNSANRLSDKFADLCGVSDDGRTISLLCENDVSYLVTQWATWICGGVSVPLCKTHPIAELEYFIENSQSHLVVCTEEYVEKVESVCYKLGVPLLVLDKLDYLPLESSVQEKLKAEDKRQKRRNNRLNQIHYTNGFRKLPALILYTSGTTGRPKGVVHTHGSLHAIITDMVTAWEWTPSDVLLHVLPLHHLHGVANAFLTPLYMGATCVMMPKFDAEVVWDKLLSPTIPGLDRRINLFMAVPTIYAKLIEDVEQRVGFKPGSKRVRDFIKAVCSSQIRLMVSGSAALPQPIMSQWEEITGHRLLERYGSTEFGMALTNPLHGNRVPGTVGQPFPKVEVCIAKRNTGSKKGYDVIAQGNARRTTVTSGMENDEGELYVRGPTVFLEYWMNPKATKETFTSDGWFKTGDTACYKDGVYKILGRSSVDIIKNGGYKISALDVEHHLLLHEDIAEVAVVGLPDITWGQRVAAVIVLASGKTEIDISELRTWAKERMPPYQVPSVIRVLGSMPRNAMGKVNKKELQQQVFPNELKQAI